MHDDVSPEETAGLVQPLSQTDYPLVRIGRRVLQVGAELLRLFSELIHRVHPRLALTSGVGSVAEPLNH